MITDLKSLSKIKTKGAKRIGRGPGSGRGKTSGRGQKGQNARGSLPVTHPHFEGGQRPLMKRLPYRRGKGNSKISKKPLIVNLHDLAAFGKNSTIDLSGLIKAKIVEESDAKQFGVKILGEGQISTALTINLPTSNSASEKIEKAGGKVIYRKAKL